jgi:hypothetical protein
LGRKGVQKNAHRFHETNDSTDEVKPILFPALPFFLLLSLSKYHKRDSRKNQTRRYEAERRKRGAPQETVMYSSGKGENFLFARAWVADTQPRGIIISVGLKAWVFFALGGFLWVV